MENLQGIDIREANEIKRIMRKRYNLSHDLVENTFADVLILPRRSTRGKGEKMSEKDFFFHCYWMSDDWDTMEDKRQPKRRKIKII